MGIYKRRCKFIDVVSGVQRGWEGVPEATSSKEMVGGV